jgi:hypothetical protein
MLSPAPTTAHALAVALCLLLGLAAGPWGAGMRARAHGRGRLCAAAVVAAPRLDARSQHHHHPASIVLHLSNISSCTLSKTDARNAPAPRPAETAAAPPKAAAAVDAWATAPACPTAPNRTNSVEVSQHVQALRWTSMQLLPPTQPHHQPTMQQDYNYRLWGVPEPGSNTSCAYRAPDGSPLYYPGYQRSSWEKTPACASAPTDASAAPRTDTEGRQWGWENDAPCAYKPAGNESARGAAPRPKPVLVRPASPAAAGGGGGGSACEGGSAPVNCLVNPCLVTTCAVGQTCVSSYCGGCIARWVGWCFGGRVGTCRVYPLLFPASSPYTSIDPPPKTAGVKQGEARRIPQPTRRLLTSGPLPLPAPQPPTGQTPSR